MAITHFEYVKKKKRLTDLVKPSEIMEYISKQRGKLLIDEEETEDFDNVMYEYIDLVYPPGSKPPTRNSRNINLLDFNQIHHWIC